MDERKRWRRIICPPSPKQALSWAFDSVQRDSSQFVRSDHGVVRIDHVLKRCILWREEVANLNKSQKIFEHNKKRGTHVDYNEDWEEGPRHWWWWWCEGIKPKWVLMEAAAALVRNQNWIYWRGFHFYLSGDKEKNANGRGYGRAHL